MSAAVQTWSSHNWISHTKSVNGSLWNMDWWPSRKIWYINALTLYNETLEHGTKKRLNQHLKWIPYLEIGHPTNNLPTEYGILWYPIGVSSMSNFSHFFTKYVTTEDADKVQFPLTLGKPSRARILPKISGLILWYSMVYGRYTLW